MAQGCISCPDLFHYCDAMFISQSWTALYRVEMDIELASSSRPPTELGLVLLN